MINKFLQIRWVLDLVSWYRRALRQRHKLRASLLWGLGGMLALLLHLGLPGQAQIPSVQAVFEAGQQLYDTGQFQAAQLLWEQASQDFAAQGDEQRLNRAAALSNLSLTHQALGNWEQARTAIEAALQSLDANRLEGTAGQLDPAPREQGRVLAQSMGIRGKLHYLTGQIDQALWDWQQAQQLYQSIEDTPGALGSLINQAQAYQALGQYLQAQATLEGVHAALPDRTPELQLKLLQSLAQTERLLGDLEAAIAYLTEAEPLVADTSSVLQAKLNLDKGHTYRAIALRQRDLGKSSAAITATQQALLAYGAAAEAASLTETPAAKLTQLQALLSQLQLHTTLADQLATMPVPMAVTDLQRAIDALLRDPNLPVGRPALFAQVGFAQSLLALTTDPLTLAVSQPVAELLGEAAYRAHALRDWRAEAYAKGTLGTVYAQTRQPQTAQELTQQAILLSTQAQAPDIRYQWYRQLGQLLAEQGYDDQSLAAYRAAVTDLQTVRNQLLVVDSEVQFSFRDTVEPVYRELIELLLKTAPTTPDQQQRIQQALENFDELQLAEINNFLGCDTGETIQLDDIDDPNAAILYAINLPDQLAVILDVPNQDAHLLRAIPYDPLLAGTAATTITEEITTIRTLLASPDDYYAARTQLQTLYQWLLAPLEPDLQAAPTVDTLVFVLDGELRNLPMAALYDGQQFLAERYKVVLSPRIKLFEPKPISRSLTAFIGGIGNLQGSIDGKGPFEPITQLEAEFQAVQAHVARAEVLQGSEFTQTNIQEILAATDFSVIHLKTHGIFSSDPEETFIVGFQELIKGRELGNLIQAEDIDGDNTVDLLVLSACETAKGDNRAVLGMTGIAVRAGARSVISSLWKSQDDVNTLFMEIFYQHLAAGEPRSEAFQAAQTYLIEQDFDISDWATYVLVGNWK